ncbi:hypothetical protein ABZ078_06590 [Streptomyces sp. NPDC006385]
MTPHTACSSAPHEIVRLNTVGGVAPTGSGTARHHLLGLQG